MRSETMTDDLILRLHQGTIASCVCGTKTPVWTYHDSLCRYRLLSEAIEEIESLRPKPQPERVREISPPFPGTTI